MERASCANNAAPKWWNACLNALVSNSSVRTAQKCAQTRIPLLRRRAFRNSRTARVDHHMVVDAWNA
eukprot:9551181-Lingulodinium_polyedra.AAC.1